jgi:hypothetical protein
MTNVRVFHPDRSKGGVIASQPTPAAEKRRGLIFGVTRRFSLGTRGGSDQRSSLGLVPLFQ